jgi:predicted transcriptional regulator
MSFFRSLCFIFAFFTKNKQRIMIASAIIAALGLAMKLGSSIYSNVKSKQANEAMAQKADEAYKQQNAESEQLKAQEGDFMNTAMGKQMVEQLRRQYNDAYKRNASADTLKRYGIKPKQVENVINVSYRFKDTLISRDTLIFRDTIAARA